MFLCFSIFSGFHLSILPSSTHSSQLVVRTLSAVHSRSKEGRGGSG